MFVSTFNLVALIALTATIFGFAGYLAGLWTATDKVTMQLQAKEKKREKRDYLLFLFIKYVGEEGIEAYLKHISGYTDKEVNQKINKMTSYLKTMDKWDGETHLKFTVFQLERKRLENLINMKDDNEEDDTIY